MTPLKQALSLAVAGVVLLGIATSTAVAARPDPGTRYAGKTSQGRSLAARVSNSGTGLEMSFREKFQCTGVSDKLLFATYKKDRPTIKPDGSFNYSKRYTGLRDPAFPGPFTNTQKITGRFTDGLRRVRGRSVARIFGKNFSCRSTITFRARRLPPRMPSTGAN